MGTASSSTTSRPSAATRIRDLAWTAAFATDEARPPAARWIVWEASQALGARSASIHELYMARGRGEVSGLHRPRHQPARPDVRHGADHLRDGRRAADVGAVILELARSEQTYTFQRPSDYATAVLAGAIAAGWHGPVFVQGDHYQFNAKKYAADPEAMTEEIRRACRLAIEAGYGNIDIDSSTLVDLSKPNARRGAARELHPGGRAHRPHPRARDRRRDRQRRWRDRRGRQGQLHRDELRAYLDGYRARARRACAPGARGLSKVSVQTGTATAACRCRTAAWPRSSSTSTS